jgi:hypothetical protein
LKRENEMFSSGGGGLIKKNISNERMRWSRQGVGNQRIFETSERDVLIRGMGRWDFWKYINSYNKID